MRQKKTNCGFSGCPSVPVQHANPSPPPVDKCEEVVQLREAVFTARARLKQAELEAEQWKEELRRLQAHSQEQGQQIHILRQERQASQERTNRLATLSTPQAGRGFHCASLISCAVCSSVCPQAAARDLPAAAAAMREQGAHPLAAERTASVRPRVFQQQGPQRSANPLHLNFENILPSF